MEKVVIESVHLKKSLWDYLFYFSLVIVVIWLILKLTGVINTPVWLEYGVPIGSFVISFLTMFQSFNDKLMKIEAQIAMNTAQLIHHDKDIERIKDALFAK